ncbi:MAG TPA: type II secretion system protein [Thermoanaerobaculia bacterium]|jgi:prepilin-type N-terminal cleavage/methylation domain-containing protein|nr:type II secretion system protein [Thermoanaerobaculia bacterium]
MPTGRSAPPGRRRRGFSLIELIVVLAILGLTLTLGLSGIVSALKRQRLNTASADINTLVNRTLAEMQNRNLATYLVFGKYVAGTGTDVVVTIDRNNDGDGFDIDTNGDGLFDDAAPVDGVLHRVRLPEDVALSNTALNAQSFNSQWLRPSSGPVSAALRCDFMGRAQIPGAAEVMISGPATVQLSHRDMIAGSLTPHVTYTVSISPLFKASVARVP